MAVRAITGPACPAPRMAIRGNVECTCTRNYLPRLAPSHSNARICSLRLRIPRFGRRWLGLGHWRPAAPVRKAAPFWHPAEAADRRQPGLVRARAQWGFCPMGVALGPLEPGRISGRIPATNALNLRVTKDQKHRERTAFHGPPQHPRRGTKRGAFWLTVER